MDGSDPPFLLPGAGAGVWRNSHLRHTPWEGRSRPKYPCGKATMTPVAGKIGHMSAPDLHKKRLETLKKQAVNEQGDLHVPRLVTASVGKLYRAHLSG